MDKILAATKHIYPHHYRPTKRNNMPGIGCDSDPEEVIDLALGFVQCLQAFGFGGVLNTLIQPYPNPLPSNCTQIGAYLTLFRQNPADQQCLACAINTLQIPGITDPITAVYTTCLGFTGARFANGGSSGQLILSRYPIHDVQEKQFDSWLLNRINVVATIKNIKIGFGHWAFNVMADYGIPGADQLMYGDTQIAHATHFIEAGVDVALGDFNSGYDYQPAGAALLASSGYQDLLPANKETWCPAGKLDWAICINQGGYSAAIDHMFVKTGSCRLSGRWNGFWNAHPLMSDHTGISGTITKWWFFDAAFEKRVMANC